MINKNLLKFSVLIVLLVILFSYCGKEDDLSWGDRTNGKTTAVFNSSLIYSILTDQDGNEYRAITVGTQTWMAENLRTTRYNDGTSIPNVTSKSEWLNIDTGAYCNYNNTSRTDTIATFGRLYNWHTVNSNKLCPSGWHVPTDEEWYILSDYLGGESVAGNKLKETDTIHWSNYILGTNETGFTALPGGARDYAGHFYANGYIGFWWSATESDSNYSWARSIDYNVELFRGKYNKGNGLSVRCLRD
jgi:uncharacterized protein (TIGR02145 family)